MAIADDLAKLKQKIAQLQVKKDRAQGALEETMRSLKAEFEVLDLKQAKQMLKQLKNEAEEKQEEFEVALNAFEQEHGDALDLY